MSISSISYSNYQRTGLKQNKLGNTPQLGKNQVAFKGLEKVATSKIATKNLEKESGKILAVLTALTTAIISFIGLKTPAQKTLEKNLNTLLGEDSALKLKEEDPALYKKMLNAYAENPELVTELMNEKLCYEHYDCQHDTVGKTVNMHSYEHIIAINEINKENPSLTDLAKVALGGLNCKFSEWLTNTERQEMIEGVKTAILKEPVKVNLILRKMKGNKEFNHYAVHQDYYTVKSLYEELKNYDANEIRAYNTAKAKAQEKFGIEITKVFADKNPSKGDCHIVFYTHNGEAKNCYLSAPPFGNTESEVLNRLINEYDSVEDFVENEGLACIKKEYRANLQNE